MIEYVFFFRERVTRLGFGQKQHRRQSFCPINDLFHTLAVPQSTASCPDTITLFRNTPQRTASEIAAAFEQRQAIKAASGIVEREGLAGWIDKAQNFYFFGFFEGETGQQAPWFLRPSITFPIAFAIVGAAFYVSYIAGAISERGAASVDELDEIIISMNTVVSQSGVNGWMM